MQYAREKEKNYLAVRFKEINSEEISLLINNELCQIAMAERRHLLVVGKYNIDGMEINKYQNVPDYYYILIENPLNLSLYELSKVAGKVKIVSPKTYDTKYRVLKDTEEPKLFHDESEAVNE